MVAADPDHSPLMVNQNRFGYQTSFVFGVSLEYRFVDKAHVEIRRNIEWRDIPPNHQFNSTRPSNKIRMGILCLCALIILAFQWQSPAALVSFIIILAIVAFVVSTYIFLRGYWRERYTWVKIGAQNLIILDDLVHDQILDEIARRRDAALLQTASIVPHQSIRQNLRRFQWLVREEIIGGSHFAALQNQMLPNLSQSLLKPGFSAGSELSFSQRSLDHIYRFELNETRLHYCHDSWLKGGKSFWVRYEDLQISAHPDEISMSHQLWPSMIAAGTLILMITYINSLMQWNPHYGTGVAGFLYGLPILGMFLGLIPLAYRLDKWARVRFTRLLPDLLIVVDSNHDVILDALRDRRLAALKWYAEPDPLLTLDEQTRILQHLAAQKVISDAEFADYTAKAKALQESLMLDQPVGSMIEDSPVPTLH